MAAHRKKKTDAVDDDFEFVVNKTETPDDEETIEEEVDDEEFELEFKNLIPSSGKNGTSPFKIIIFSSLNLLFLLASIIGFFIKTNSYIRVFSSIDPFFYPLVVLQSIISFARVWGENVNIWPFLVTIALYCILNLWILWYLIFGKKSKEFFNQS